MSSAPASAKDPAKALSKGCAECAPRGPELGPAHAIAEQLRRRQRLPATLDLASTPQESRKA